MSLDVASICSHNVLPSGCYLVYEVHQLLAQQNTPQNGNATPMLNSLDGFSQVCSHFGGKMAAHSRGIYSLLRVLEFNQG